MDIYRASMPAGSHPHHQGPGSGEADRQDQENDEHLMPALVARQMRKQ